jgi:hypothetical protein
MRDHAVLLNIYTVMYGWRLAFVPLVPADATVVATVIPVVAELVLNGLELFAFENIPFTVSPPAKKTLVV